MSLLNISSVNWILNRTSLAVFIIFFPITGWIKSNQSKVEMSLGFFLYSCCNIQSGPDLISRSSYDINHSQIGSNWMLLQIWLKFQTALEFDWDWDKTTFDLFCLEAELSYVVGNRPYSDSVAPNKLDVKAPLESEYEYIYSCIFVHCVWCKIILCRVCSYFGID